MTAPALELVDIAKRFGSVVALTHASLTLRPGVVHAIVGENGAGKSTLLAIGAGILRADAGEVRIAGTLAPSLSPQRAAAAGIGMVHQHFSLVPTLTGLENLALGNEPTRGGLLSLGELRKRALAIGESLEMPLRLDDPIEALSVGERQRLEIVRACGASALANAPGRKERGERARVIIFDEPTAVLAPSEAQQVLALMRRLAKEGVAVALVTHHLDEVVAVADELTVMRKGLVVSHHQVVPRDAAQIAREALGELPVVAPRKSEPEKRGPVVLSLAGVSAASSEREGAAHEALVDASLEVHAGEIVGVAGVSGNGQGALELLAAGLAAPDAGSMLVLGVDASSLDVRARRRRGLAWIASDRHAHAMMGALSAADGARLGAWSEVASRGPFGVIDEAALLAAHARAVAMTEIHPTDPALAAGALSGGNQQKLVVARELRGLAEEERVASPPRLVIAAEPTRGIDARASALVRALLRSAADRGAGVLLISSDLDELRLLADRLVVLRGGRIAAELPKDASSEALGAAMLGTEAHPSAREAAS